MTMVGDKPMNFARQFLSKDDRVRDPAAVARLLLRARSALPVNVLEGEIKGDAKKPVAGYVATPWAKYPPGLPVPAAPDSAEAKAGGGGGASTRAEGTCGCALASVVLLASMPLAVVASRTTRSRRRRRAAAPRRAPAAAKTQSPNVRIVFTVLPSTKKATVFWGKKKLGAIGPHAPLIVQRPRDSGPLDVVVRADGCVPVQTRAYTFEDSKVAVKVTPNDEKNTLLGYREEIPRR